MNPEDYRRLKELFHSALELDAHARRDFLDRECGGDVALRVRLEAMLAADEGPPDFLDRRAFEVAAPLLCEADAPSPVGRRLGHYEVLAPLGAGGMGDVYLATDTRLGRKVALKLLPDYLSDDSHRVRRFQREARAASALNHPNIAAIYDIGEADGRHFIATELVEGVTLRQRMLDAPLSLSEVLSVATQVAGVLAKAHRAGITHRDIKPENLMLTADGLVKVLDFGLAKYNAPARAGRDGDSPRDSTLTSPGLVLGTPAYMSPEQARGLEVDARTDLWSLGVVLYEMVAGRPPFSGPTTSDLLVAILEHEPEPLAGESFAVPQELERVVAHALRKALPERYQTAEEFAADLERLRRRFKPDSGSEQGWSLTHTEARTSSGPAHRRARFARRLSQTLAGVGGRRVALSLLLTACAAALIYAWWSSRRAEIARSAPPAPAAERRLSYWLLVQKQRAGRPFEEPFRLSGAGVFESDDLIRINLRGSQDGYLYILNQGPERDEQAAPFVVLFPSPTANGGAALLPAERQIQVPESSWFRFDEARGTEKIWLVWSPAGIPLLDAVKGFANPRDRGVVKDPALNRAVGEFLQEHAARPRLAAEDGQKKEMVIKWEGDILTHLLRLEHR